MDSSKNGNANALQPLVYSGEIIQQRGEMLSLTNMWKAAGGEVSKRPVDWLRSKEAREFIEHVELMVGNSHLLLRTPGRSGATLAHWQIGLAYAKYLSPEFHIWCNTVVRERMESRHASMPMAVDPETRKIIGGIVKSIVHAEIATALTTILPQLVRAALAEGMAVRRGKTAGQIYRDAGFPPVKGISAWLGNTWARLGFQIDGNARGELGTVTARLFDPDKVSTWLKAGGRAAIEQRVKERCGQTRLFRIA